VNPKDRYQNAGAMLEDLVAWKPRPCRRPVEAPSAESWQASKGVLGTWSPCNESEAQKMVTKAIEFSRQANALGDAADLLEEALNKWPGLRTEYQDQLRLWRRGISM
jgi:serine/threonine-protein kinase